MNAFISTALEKHVPEIVNERLYGKLLLMFFTFHLPLIKKKENKHLDNVNLTPINYRDKSFKEFLTTNDNFIPIHFDLRNTEEKKKLPKLCIISLKKLLNYQMQILLGI